MDFILGVFNGSTHQVMLVVLSLVAGIVLLATAVRFRKWQWALLAIGVLQWTAFDLIALLRTADLELLIAMSRWARGYLFTVLLLVAWSQHRAVRS